MGTRASFWINNPTDLQNRVWLGCIAYDGNPESLPELYTVSTQEEFQKTIVLYSDRADFSSPDNGWPFPWNDDIFVTDFTYFWDDSKVMFACFHTGFFELPNEIDWDSIQKNNLPYDVSAPSEYNPEQPDSIIIVREM